MSTVTDAIGAHHRELTTKLTTEVTAIEEGTADAAGLIAFLKEDLLPHAAGEERHLYPVIADLVKAHGDATTTMRIEHEYIERASRQIEELAQAVRDATTEQERAERHRQLVRVAAQLEATLRQHVEKEERGYLPLFERYVPAEEQRRILDDMHETADAQQPETAANTPALDVRPLPPAQRHALIFRTFEALAPGQAFVLVNDHDPKPLYYQLNFEHRGTLLWEYLEEGPEDWRVRIGKTA